MMKLVIRACLVVGALALAGTWTAVSARADIVIQEKRSWKALASTDHVCSTHSHTFVGSGVVTIRIKMAPYYGRNMAMSRESVFTSGLPDIGGGMGMKYLVGDGSDGKPADFLIRYRLRGGTNKVDFRLCNPVKCNFAGACSQYGATGTFLVDWASGADENTPITVPGGAAVAANPPPSPAADMVNVARHGRASQSSTYYGSCPAGADAANDGVTAAEPATSCSAHIAHTQLEDRPWWRVDLGGDKAIGKIVIWNRGAVAQERLTNFAVTLRNAAGQVVFSKTYYGTGGYPKPTFTITWPKGIRAAQVQIQLNGRNYLNLAEVEVFGTP